MPELLKDYSQSANYVYLDWAATAPLCEEAASVMAPYQVSGISNLLVGGNANSLHTPGRAAFKALEDARKQFACDIGARRPDEIIFTSGATEADDAALFGLARAEVNARYRRGLKDFVPHVIVSAIEHDAVLAPAKRLESQGFRVTRLNPNRQGFIEVEKLEEVVDSDTVLVSIQAANSELGSIQSIEKLAQVAHASGALFHTDAVQILGKASVNVESWGVDAASFSAHKVGGPKGVGALYLKARTPFESFMLGGGQEAARRSGTQNVAGIVGFAAAASASIALQESEELRLSLLRDKLYVALERLAGVEPTVKVSPGSAAFLPNIVHVLIKGMESETLILRLDALGFGVSGGSACSSHSLEPSHVLSAVGINSDRAHGALRISMGRYTTEQDIDAFVDALRASLDWNTQ